MKQITTRVEDDFYKSVEAYARRQRGTDLSRSYSMSDAVRDLIARGLKSANGRAKAKAKK